MKIFRIIIIVFFLIAFSLTVFPQDVIFEPTENPSAVYRLFRTRNIWTFIQLNTITGKIWQVQFSTKGEEYRFSSVINSENLSENKKLIEGRFTLYPTSNMYTFILLDTIDGDTWQVQWSMESEDRMIIPIY